MKRSVSLALLLLVACRTAPRVAPDQTEGPAPAPSPLQRTRDSFRFAVIGDSGTGGEAQGRVARRMCRWRVHHPFQLVVTTGDNIYPNGDPDLFYERFRRPYACLLDGGVRFHASLGNHDVMTRDGRPEIDRSVFGMRARNYVIREMGVRIVIADSNGLNRRWLRRALTPDEGDRWTIVVFHHPVYSSGTGHGSTPGFRSRLPRMFRRKGVDLALAGHDHVYFASRRIRGVRYVVTGGGGGPLYGCANRWFTARCESRHHFLSVTAGSDHIRAKAVPPSGPPFHVITTSGI